MDRSENKYKILILILVFIFALVGVFFAYKGLSKRLNPYVPPALSKTNNGSDKTNEDNNTNDDKQKAPDFLVYNDKGEEVTFSSLIGKPVVINFWATWCPYCVQEMADFNEIYLTVEDDVHFMMINQTDGNRETKKKAQDYVAKEGFDFPVYFDLDFNAARVYGITSLPTTIFIDKDGYYYAGYLGALNKTVVKEHVDLLLDK